MTNNRPIKRLWEIIDIQNWFAFDANFFDNKEWFPIIRIRDIKRSHTDTKYKWQYKEEFIVRKWDFLIGMDWEFRCYVWNWEDALLNQRVCRILKNSNDIDMNYLLYWINDFLKRIEDTTAFVTVKHISSKQIKEIKFPLPPLTTQKLIVAKLDEAFVSLDESIVLTQENITKLDEMTKSVLDKVFEEGKWEKKKIGDLIEKTATRNPSEKPNEKFNYIDISSIDNKIFKITETKEILGKDAPSRAKKLLEKDDIIYATTRPNLKNIAICELNISNLTCSTWFCVLRTKKNRLSNKYLFHYITTDIFFKKIEKFIRWAQYPAVSDKDLKELEIPLPPLSKQQEIVTYLDQIFAETKQLKTEYETKLSQLKELKSSILQSAFEGKLI